MKPLWHNVSVRQVIARGRAWLFAFVPCSALPPGSCVMALIDPWTWQKQTDWGFELFESKNLDTWDECVFSSATGIFSSSTFFLVLVTDFRGNVFFFEEASKLMMFPTLGVQTLYYPTSYWLSTCAVTWSSTWPTSSWGSTWLSSA